LSYNRNIKKNSLNFLVGINATSSTGDGMGLTYKGFPSGELSSPDFANELSGLPSNSDSKSRLFGALGTIRMTISILPMLPFVSTAVLSLVPISVSLLFSPVV
jgi:hypothetical protein